MDDIHCRICGATLYEISRLERLTQLDLAHIQPVLVFPEEEA
jgi:hypothetical protein